ncbi:hypothetical protein M3Y99_00171000 [Aphelenchoides fujianensis]|nr:hypothetical protein M3Y99_00171000 [Aphelenchoides fujianensis]
MAQYEPIGIPDNAPRRRRPLFGGQPLAPGGRADAARSASPSAAAPCRSAGRQVAGPARNGPRPRRRRLVGVGRRRPVRDDRAPNRSARSSLGGQSKTAFGKPGEEPNANKSAVKPADGKQDGENQSLTKGGKICLGVSIAALVVSLLVLVGGVVGIVMKVPI